MRHTGAGRHAARRPTLDHAYSQSAAEYHDDADTTDRRDRRAGHRAGPRWRCSQRGENESHHAYADRRDEESCPELNESHSSRFLLAPGGELQAECRGDAHRVRAEVANVETAPQNQLPNGGIAHAI